MGVSFAVVPTVFKREDYKQTQHDEAFSNWQVLIGSNDWEDFKNGKEGVGRYRVQNLPRKSCPGLYELGVTIINHDDHSRKLHSDDVLASYLGQAENVRSRLQRYGRSGAHLSNSETIEDIFNNHGSIVYRWAPMRSKREAEATEGLLLSTFDYAWNKGSNGERRELDLLNKLGDYEFMSMRKFGIPRMLLPFLRNQVGIEKHVVKEEKKSDHYQRGVGSTGNGPVDTATQVKTPLGNDHITCADQTPARSGQMNSLVSDETNGFVCGVIFENGGCCDRVPVKGRKRCVEHKGQRVFRVSPKPEEILSQDSDVMCGVILPNMEACSKRAICGRKRCEDHKGMRINAFLFLLNRTDREKTVKEEEISNLEESRFCEATTKNGSPCTRSSPKGSKRCWQHKEKSPENVQTEVVVCGVKLCNGLI